MYMWYKVHTDNRVWNDSDIVGYGKHESKHESIGSNKFETILMFVQKGLDKIPIVAI